MPIAIRAVLAETLGTAMLVAATVGSGLMASQHSQDSALVLLIVAIATGLVLAILIQTFGAISGAHFNPVVSLILFFSGRVDARILRSYVFAQMLGGFMGIAIANSLFHLNTWSVSTQSRISAIQFSSEFVATAGLLIVILSLLHFDRSRFISPAVGIWVTSAIAFTPSTAFANPAVTIGRTFTESASGIAPTSAAWFVLAQILGALAGWSSMKLLKGKP